MRLILNEHWKDKCIIIMACIFGVHLESKKCACCQKIKPIDEFYKRGRCPKEKQQRHRSHCKECLSIKAAIRWETDENFKQRGKDHAYRYSLKKNYGVTEADYLKILAEQNGVCKICQQNSHLKSGRLALDHCHKTGRVRGLLCTRCNAGIGMFNDDLERIKKAIAYLEESTND